MVFLIVLKSVLPPGNEGNGYVGNESQSIRVGYDPSNRDQLSVAWIIGCRGGNQPASKEMRDWGHSGRSSGYLFGALVPMPIFLRNGSSDRGRPRNFSMETLTSRELPGSYISFRSLRPADWSK